MRRSSLQSYKIVMPIIAVLLCLLVVGIAGRTSQAIAQQTSTSPEPFVAIHVSELTQVLDTMPAVWHNFVGYESLKEALRSDGTPFIVVSDSDISAGKLRNADGSPKYPIVISLAAEAIADAEISPIRDYVNAGGFLFVGSSAFTRNPDGTSRGNFALASEMGLHVANSNLSDWYVNNQFAKIVDHRLTSHIPDGTLAWYGPLTAEEIPWGISPSHVQHTNHYAWQVVAANATVLANGDLGPLLAVKSYGQGQFIYHGAFQPLIGHGGYDPGMYEYLIYRKAIEWAFESFSLPIVKVSPWPYQYDAAFIIRHDFEDNQTSIKAIASSAQLEHSLGAKGDYYFSTGALRVNMGGDPTTVSSLRSAVSNYGATIGSHNGGLKNPNNPSLVPSAYDYWHWGPDEALDTSPAGYASGKAYATASVLASFQDISGWLAGLDNGRAGCGAAGTCPRTWVSPYFNSTREGSYDVLEQLGSVTAGEQKISPFPHWTMSYQTSGKRYAHITLPVSDWYIGSSVAQCLTYNDGSDVYSVYDIRAAVDFYYDLGTLINFYGHMPSNHGTVGTEYISYSMSKPRIWPTNAVGVNDWWRLRSNVLVTPTIISTGGTYTVTTSVSGAADDQTSIELVLPQIQGQPISNMSVFFNGAPAGTSEYRTTNSGVKVRVGSSVSTVQVQYTMNSHPVAVDDTYSTVQNTTLNQTAPGVLSNDTSPTGATLTAQLLSSPANGTLTLNANGSFSYTPATNFAGNDGFTYTAYDGTANSNTATVSITVGYQGIAIAPHEVTSASTGGVCNAPANIAAGNLLIASFLQGSKSGNPTIPSGWVLDRTQDFNNAAYRECVAHKIAGSSEPGAYTFSGYSGSGIYDLSIVRLDGNDTSNPVDSGAIASSSVVSSSIDYTFPTVTTANVNDLLYYVGESTGTPSCAWPGGTLELYDPIDGHSAGYEIRSAQGVATPRKITWSSSSSERMGIVVAYKSATGTANNPVPATTGLSPASASAGGAAFTLTVNGSNFINGSVVQWKGAGRTATYVSSTQLTASITAADIATAGTASVTVFNPAPGGGTSNAQTFTINAGTNPVPATTGLSPASATAGGAAFTLTVNGSNFINGSVVQWKGAGRTATYVSSTQLTASITAADIATAGTASVTVFNPAPGGGTSNAQTFTINAGTNPVPATTGLSPASATAGGAAFTLTVNGSNFINGSVVQWNGAGSTTTYLSSTQLTAAVTAADIATAGTASVTVFNPAPGGGISNAQTFTINAVTNPVPATTGLSPATTNAGGPAFTLTVNGSNFINGSVVQWNGAGRTTTYLSSAQLTAAITTADIATAGTATVTVFNPAPGGGTSNAQTFTINAGGTNPVPATTGLSPTSATAGGSAFTLTVNGSNFVNGSVVQWNGSSRTTTASSTTVSDDFNRANSNPLGGNWTTVPGTNNLKLLNNAIAGAVNCVGTNACDGYWNANTFSNDQCSQVTLILAGSGIYSGPIVRASQSAKAYYALNANGSSNYQIYKVANGLENILGANIAVVPKNNDIQRICVIGNSITAYINGTLQGTRTDSTITTGSPGIEVSYSNTANPTLDNWSGWSVGAGSSTQLTAAITAADIATAGTASVTVFNPAPGGGTSNAQTFTINAVTNPVPATTSLSPASDSAGGAAFTLTVNGSNFINGSVVQWNGTGRTTTYLSSTQLTAAITAADIATAGTASVTVFNPAPGGGTSNAQTFTINAVMNPVPATTGLSPASATAGGAAFTLTVNGSNFINASVVQWMGANRTTTYVSATQLTASITAADIASAGTALVTVFNPAPGGGTSNAQTFTINDTNSTPAVTALNGWTNLYSASPNNTGASNLAVGSFTVGSGSSRMILVSVIMEIGRAANPTISAAYGGTALTQIGITANTQREIVWMGYLKDAQIGSGSKGLTISYSGASGNVNALHVKWASYSGVNQANPVASSAARNVGSTSVTFGSTINFVNSGMTVVVAGNGGTPATATLTANPSFTAGTATTSNSQTSRTFTTAQHTAAGSYSSTTSVTWSGTASPRSGLVVVSLQP